MAKRRTSGIQRRERASAEALNRRLDERGALPDWRLLAIGGLLVVGVIVIALVLIFGSGPSPYAGTVQADAGQEHVSVGTTCRGTGACGADPYSSVPATSGPHWDPSGVANWGVYSTPQNETQLVHNLEHGGIVIWYDPERVEQEAIDTLTRYVNAQTASGASGRFKFILTPWGGEPALGAPIAVTAWRYLLELEEANTAAIDEFARAHYGRAPEPNGGPGPPGT